jgi:hypothetical protein
MTPNDPIPTPAPTTATGLPPLRLDFGSGGLPVINHHGTPCVDFRRLCDFVGANFDKKRAEAQGNGFMHALYADSDHRVLLAASAVPLWLAVLDYVDVAEENRHGYREWIVNGAEPLQAFRSPAAGPPRRFSAEPNAVRLAKDDLIPMSIGERQGVPTRVMHGVGQDARDHHREELRLAGYEFVGVDDRFADDPDHDPLNDPSEIWRRERNGIVEWAEIANTGPFDDKDFTPPDRCWVVLRSNYDPRLIEY